MSSEVLYKTDGHIATVTLNRPDVQNTISQEMLDGICEHLLKADQDENVRAIIMTGSGRFFCGGLDMRGDGLAKNLASDRAPTDLNLRNIPPTVMHNLSKPLICALGSAAGYGLDLALCCDIRIMSEDAKLAVAYVARGITPESGGTWILPRLLGWSKAAELIFSGRTVNAPEALELGLVSNVVPADQVLPKAQEIAEQIAANAPLAVQAAKRMMRMGLTEPFDEHVNRVFLQLIPLTQSRDFREAMSAFMEKRSPAFEGR